MTNNFEWLMSLPKSVKEKAIGVTLQLIKVGFGTNEALTLVRAALEKKRKDI